MRTARRFLPILLMFAVAGCAGASQSPATPTTISQTAAPAAGGDATSTPPPADSGPCVVGFDELKLNGAPFASHAACGLAITATAGTWQAVTTYGHPAPFIEFFSPGGTTTVGEVSLASAGAAFSFVSVDIYSSTTRIPYEITGLAKGIVVYTLADVQGNTFGNFATIGNPRPGVAIDTLRIRLTNPSAPCCTNPVGLDTVRIVR